MVRPYYGLVIAIATVAAVATAWLITLTVVVPVLNGQNVKTINLVGPASGDVDLVAGNGIAVVPSASTHAIEIENTGVLTVNSLDPAAGGNIVLAATAPGLTVTSAGSTVTFTNGGVTQAIAGSGIGVSAPTGPVTFSNTGVLSVTIVGTGLSTNASTGALALANTGVLSLTAGSGIGLNASTGAIIVSNSGVLTINSAAPISGNMVVAQGAGTTVTTATNTVTVADTISVQTALAKSNALAPTVSYAINIGSTTAVPVNTWRIGPAVGAPPNPWSPGSSDAGYGNVAGTSWAVPSASVGIFTASINCDFIPNTIAVNDLQTASIALSFGATTEDPASGTIPSGGYQTIRLAGGTNSGTPAALPPQLSLSATFQAGCTGCPIAAGEALTVHARTDHTGTGVGNYSMTSLCALTVTHLR